MQSDLERAIASIRVRVVGVTATRSGMRTPQLATARTILTTLRDAGAAYLHHGDCIGGDDQFDSLADDLGYHIVIHPPTDSRFRAYCLGQRGATTARGKTRRELPPRRFLDRNQQIVMATGILLGASAHGHEHVRSGTWSTIRFARARRMPRVVLWPDGRATIEEDL
jgi:hypothetical protein